VRNGPGSAAHHFVLRCARDTCSSRTRGHATSARDANLREAVLPLFTLSNSHLSCTGRNSPPAPASNCNSPSPWPLAHRAPGPEPSSFISHPRGGGGAPTGACSLLLCRAGQARRAPCDRCARLSALHRGDFWSGSPRVPSVSGDAPHRAEYGSILRLRIVVNNNLQGAAKQPRAFQRPRTRTCGGGERAVIAPATPAAP
jgi:hypothetical protein